MKIASTTSGATETRPLAAHHTEQPKRLIADDQANGIDRIGDRDAAGSIHRHQDQANPPKAHSSRTGVVDACRSPNTQDDQGERKHECVGSSRRIQYAVGGRPPDRAGLEREVER